ncbi:MAG: extracellular solute-binding protein [Bdellovibrionota bacterium]
MKRIGWILAAISLAGLFGGTARAEDKKLAVLTAASMRSTMDELAALYRKQNPGLEVTIQSGGSTALARKALDLQQPADVIVLADESLFGDLLEPKWCSYHVRFATERVVLAYHESALGSKGIDRKNWAQVLLKEDVRIGMANPKTVPVGYRTLMALKLADLLPGGGGIEKSVLAKVGERNLRSDVAELIAPLETGAFDYAFVYGATAKEAGLLFVELPPEVNLGDPNRTEEYAKVSVEITGKNPGETIAKKGGPVLYGASVGSATKLPKEAEGFLSLLLSEKGRAILEKHGFGVVRDDKYLFAGSVPESVRKQAAR